MFITSLLIAITAGRFALFRVLRVLLLGFDSAHSDLQLQSNTALTPEISIVRGNASIRCAAPAKPVLLHHRLYILVSPSMLLALPSVMLTYYSSHQVVGG